MEYFADGVQPRLPDGYVFQHTLWTRKTFNAQKYSREWRSSRGMMIPMPRKDEMNLHADFFKLFPEKDRYGGLPLPSRELTRVAMAHLKAINPILGRKQQFESMTRYVRELAYTATNEEDANEAKLFAGHFALQLDYFHGALTADDERELGLWRPGQF